MTTARRVAFDPVIFAMLGYGVLLMALTVLYFAANAQQVPVVNAFTAGLILLIGLSTASLLYLTDPASLISPIFWFYLACATYFGFGALAAEIGPVALIGYINFTSGYPIDDRGRFEANLLSVCGVFLCSVGLYISRLLIDWRKWDMAAGLHHFDVRDAKRVLWVFLAIGLPVKYGVAIPRIIGIETGFTLGAIEQLAMTLNASIIILVFLLRRGEQQMIWLLWILVVSEFFTSLLSGSKLNVLFTVITLMIAISVVRPKLHILAVAAALTFWLYATILQPFVLYMRYLAGGGSMSVDTLQRAVVGLFNGEMNAMQGSQIENLAWWGRLNYQNYQSFAIDSVRNGSFGESYNELATVLLPRALFPDKPSTGFGKQLADLLNPGSGDWVQVAMGMFAEGWWNGGALSLIATCFWAAFVLAVFSYLIARGFVLGRVETVVLALFALQTAIAVDRWYIGTFVGGFALVLVYAAFMEGVRIFAPARAIGLNYRIRERQVRASIR